MPNTIKVALTSEENRYQTIFRSLDLLTQEINNQIGNLDEKEDYILIKPNCVFSNHKDCATHPEAIKALLDILNPLWSGRIILAEGSAQNTLEAFRNYGYDKFKNEFPNLEFLDLNYSEAIFTDIFDSNLKPLTIKLSNTFVEAPFKISIGPPKTHDSTIVTLSIKNCAVGAILKENKTDIHQGPKAINRSIAAIDEYTRPDLAIIDGWQGMEGRGPIHGHLLNTKFALASMNALAADAIAAKIMGFDPDKIGYLHFLGVKDIMNNIKVAGKDLADFQFHFTPHPGYFEQIQWL